MVIVVIIFLFLMGFTSVFTFYVLSKYKELKDFKLILVGGLFIILFLTLLVFSTNTIFHDLAVSKNLDELGQHGDYVGGMLNPLISVFAVFAAGFAFYAQYQANKQVQNQFKIQQFESQFYEMLRLHKENINEMTISGYKKSIEITTEHNATDGSKKYIATEKKIENIVRGRKVFVSMMKELIFCCDVCIEINKEFEGQLSKEAILKLGYRIFFHGSNSSFIRNNDCNGVFLERIKSEFNLIRASHKSSKGDYNRHNINLKTINLNIKYSPFTGHTSRLSHYYRHLFYTVKFVVENEQNGLFNYKKSRAYLKLLRAQMSNDEQLLLYYNYKIGFGGDWENSENKFFSKYRLLHNLPTKQVKYYNPLNVFKKQIQDIKNETNGKETMFEWGDE